MVGGRRDTLSLGKHTLDLPVTAPMVHWPEVIMTYDDTPTRLLFSADGFGKFGAPRRGRALGSTRPDVTIFGIVGKYGAQVQSATEKSRARSTSRRICPLHGPVLS